MGADIHVAFPSARIGGLGVAPPPTAALQYLIVKFHLHTEPQPEEIPKNAAERKACEALDQGVQIQVAPGRDDETLWRDGLQKTSK